MKNLLRWACAIACVLLPTIASAQTQLPPVKDWGGHTVPGGGGMIVGADGVEKGTATNPLIVSGGSGGGGDPSSTGTVGSSTPPTAVSMSGLFDGATVRRAASDTSGRAFVNVFSLPALPAGSNTIGSIANTSFVGIPTRATSTATGGTIAQANTYQSALSANPTRLDCLLQNTSAATMRVYVGSTGATDAAAFQISAGGTFGCGTGNGFTLTDQLYVASATAGATYVVVSQ